MAVTYQNVGGQIAGENTVKSNRRLAEAMMQAGMNPGPMTHWTQALGSALQTGIGAYKNDRANQAEDEGRASGNRALAQALAGGGYDAAMANPYSADQALQMQVADRNRGADVAQRKAFAEWQSQQPDAQADIAYKRAQTDALLHKQNDPVEAYLLQRLQGSSAQAPQGGQPGGSPAMQPQLQPQSFEGNVPQTGLINVADQSAPPEAMPQPQQQQDMIETPYGRMSSEEARQLGGTMLLSPKYAPAGRALLDSVGTDRGGLAKPSINQLEERTLNSATQLARMDDIKKRFRPEFLEIPKRLQMMGLSWSAKLGQQLGGKLNPQQSKELRDYAAFRSSSVNNLNTILKELSGAAVTPQEYERIQNDQPVAGTGVFDGDDPVSFQAKSDRTTQTLRAAIARFNFMRSRGLSFDKNSLDQFMSLDDVPAAIERRGSEIEQQLRQRNPQIQPQMLEQQTTRQLKREFGI